MITIRAATQQDSDSIASIYNSATGSSSNKQSWNEVLASRTLVVAEINDRLVGFGGLDLESVTPLKWLYVAPGSQRTGIRSMLLEKLETEARSAGLRFLRLHAAPDATSFYSQHGYREVPIEEKHAHDHEGLEMVKDLDKRNY